MRHPLRRDPARLAPDRPDPHGRARRQRRTSAAGSAPSALSALAALAVLAVGGATLTACGSGGGHSGPRAAAASDVHKPTASPKPKPKPTVVWDTTPRSVAAVGDSITRGFDTCSVLTDCPKASWATGSDRAVDSLAVRLLGRKGAVGHSWNHAKTGARMAAVAGQMRKAAAHHPDLVTVMAGANDACRDSADRMTPVADFREDFEKALATLRDLSPRTEVYVSSIPNLMRLWSQGRTSPLGKRVWKLGICPSMLENADAHDAKANKRRARVQQRVVAYNKVLAEVCSKDARCRDDDGAVFDYRFTTAQLSHWDWFHPSRDGQSRLAEIAYRAVVGKETRTEAVS